MYTGEVDTLEKDNFEDVNKMAHVFDVSWLTKRCLKFYKTDVLNFENNSYDEILFACEIASRAHYNLKQSNYVGCFVRNMTTRNIGKMIFLQRYMADFADLSKRQIDMSLAVAGSDYNIIITILTFHLTKVLRCKNVDENSLYLLRNFSVGKFRQGFPQYFGEVAQFLAEIAEVSESCEVKEIVKEFVVSRSSQDEILDTSETVDDCVESDCEEDTDVAFQTEGAECGIITNTVK